VVTLEVSEQRLERGDSLWVSARSELDKQLGDLAARAPSASPSLPGRWHLGQRAIAGVPAHVEHSGSPSTQAAGGRENRQLRQRGRPRAAARSQPTHTAPRSVIAAIRLRCAQCEQRGVGSGAQRRQTDGPLWLL
jgi:hypothetical protein